VTVEAGLAEQLVAGRYRLRERIGVGGMAEVYRAEDSVLDRPVAVKMLHPGLEDADVARRRLQSEVRLLARLSHPGLVPVFDAGNESGRAFLVMQLVEGGTLAQRIHQGPLDIDEAAAVAAELAEVLRHLHEHQLVHRDVKPSNVLLHPPGRVLLTDFGIARALDAANLTGTNTTVGTAAYMAPEQVRGETVGAPADVYALGLVLNECVSGARAFQGQNPFAVAAARLHRPPTVAAEAAARWPGLVQAMTDPEPGRRPSAAQVAATLRDQVVSNSTAAPRIDRTAVMPVPVGSSEGSSSVRADVEQRARDAWDRRPELPDLRAVRLHMARAHATVSEYLRLALTRLARRVAPRYRGPFLFAGVTLCLLVAIWLAAAGEVEPAPQPRGATGAVAPAANSVPPGTERLPADLDRLERAVQRR
jgi:serine/threonine protein kinase